MLFTACDLAVPQRIQVSTTFGLHMPIGDLAELQEVRDALEYTKIERIAELFNNENQKVQVYYYTEAGYVIPLPDNESPNKNAEGPFDATNAARPDEVRSLFFHFPLVSLNLDFAEYLRTDVIVPDIVVPEGPSSYPRNLATVTVPLGEMSRWVESIDLNGDTGKSIVTLEGGAQLQDTLQLAIPALGIGVGKEDFRYGTAKNNNLMFTATVSKTLQPKTEPVIIYSRLTEVPAESGGHFAVTIDLKWTKAEVVPGDGVYSDTIILPFGQFSEYTDKYEIMTLPCYFYVGGPFDDTNKAEVGLKAGEDWIIGTGETAGEVIEASYPFQLDKNALSDGFYSGSVPESAAPFNLAAKANDNSHGDLELIYWIRVPDLWVIRPDDGGGVITADLVAVLPLQFEIVEGEKKTFGGEEYVNIMAMTDYDLNGGYDLFGRDRGESSFFVPTDVRFSGKDMRNTLFSGSLYLHLYDNYDILDQLITIKPGENFYVDVTGTPYIPVPFHPVFAVYVKKPENGPTVLKIDAKKAGVDDIFAVKLSADVTGMTEYEQDL
jgi:hypothetical protein